MNELSRMEVRADDIIQYGYIAVKQFPKSERYAMGGQIRRLTVGIGVHIARAVAIRHVGMRKKEVEELLNAENPN